MTPAGELGKLVALEVEGFAGRSAVEASILADSFTYFGGLAPERKGERFPTDPMS